MALEPIILPPDKVEGITGEPTLDEHGNPIVVTPTDEPVKTDPPASDPPVDRGVISDFKSEGLEQLELENADGTKSNAFLNSDGRIVDDTGKVLYTKEEADALLSDVDLTELSIENVSKLSGIELKDETGATIQFDNTPAGFAAREAKIREQSYNEGANSSILEFFNEHPDIKQIFEFKQKNNTIDGFKPSVDYTTITLDKTNEAQLMEVIVEANMKQGKSKEQAEKYAAYIKANNTLYEEALDNQSVLKQMDATAKAEVQKQKDLDYQNTLNKVKQKFGYFVKDGKVEVLDNEGSVYNTIVTKGQIGEFRIPDVGLKVPQPDGSFKLMSRRQIADYISLAADKYGNSQAMIDYNARLSNPQEELMAYITTLLGGNISQLAKQTIAHSKAKEIRSVKLTSVKDINATPGNPNDLVSLKLQV